MRCRGRLAPGGVQAAAGHKRAAGGRRSAWTVSPWPGNVSTRLRHSLLPGLASGWAGRLPSSRGTASGAVLSRASEVRNLFCFFIYAASGAADATAQAAGGPAPSGWSGASPGSVMPPPRRERGPAPRGTPASAAAACPMSKACLGPRPPRCCPGAPAARRADTKHPAVTGQGKLAPRYMRAAWPPGALVPGPPAEEAATADACTRARLEALERRRHAQQEGRRVALSPRPSVGAATSSSPRPSLP